MRGVANCNAVTRAQRPGPGLQLKPASNKLVYVNRGFSPAARMSNAPARRLKITGSSSPAIRFSVRVIRTIFNETLGDKAFHQRIIFQAASGGCWRGPQFL